MTLSGPPQETTRAQARPAPVLDLLFVADPRFEGGASTALAAEISAAAAAGFRLGLLMVLGPLLGRPMPMHPQLEALCASGAVTVIDPEEAVSAALTIIHHPTIFRNPTPRFLPVESGKLVLVLHHPRIDQVGQVQYDLDRVVANCRASFRAADVLIAPVSIIVRNTLPAYLPAGAKLLAEDWDNLIVPEEWPMRPERACGTPLVIGRHSRPDAQKFPLGRDTALAVYPDDPARFRVRMLGGGAFLKTLYDEVPNGWELIPFDAEPVGEFLCSLDVYVYFHGPVWLEAFGRTILEAILCAVPVVLAPSFEPLFGPMALYAEPEAVVPLITALAADEARYKAHVAAARAAALARFSANLFPARLWRLFGLRPGGPNGGTKGASTPRAPLPRADVLFLSTNGIGLGHLTQQLAIADRLPADLRATFATMSYGLRLVREAGYEAHFLPHHRSLGAPIAAWNAVFAEELFDLVAYLRPRVIAYDGTVPFGGLVRALTNFPEIFSLWVRRPFWRQSHATGMAHADTFTAVAEPGEFAEDFDLGPTRPAQKWILRVPPVLHLSPGQRLGREAAQAALGLDGGGITVALQLGSGANFDMEGIRAEIIDALLRHEGVRIVDFHSPIAPTPPPRRQHPRLVERRHFPMFAVSRAFDFAITAAGYNAFHEAIYGAVPTIFVPNEANEMDLQAARGAYAEREGLGFLLRRDHDRYRVRQVIDAMLHAPTRRAIATRCAALPFENGADPLARFIAMSARMLRTDHRPEKHFDMMLGRSG